MFGKKCKHGKTKVVVNCDAGFPNTITIRGEGIPGLSWNKGLPLKNIKKDQWEWECEGDFSSAKFKLLLNDKNFEIGDNHIITCGNVVRVTPKF